MTPATPERLRERRREQELRDRDMEFHRLEMMTMKQRVEHIKALEQINDAYRRVEVEGIR